MDAATLVTIITMFIVTDNSSEFIKYDGLMDCMKDKREIERKKDGRRAICGPSMAEIDKAVSYTHLTLPTNREV